jgi:hypothetical protein
MREFGEHEKERREEKGKLDAKQKGFKRRRVVR